MTSVETTGAMWKDGSRYRFLRTAVLAVRTVFATSLKRFLPSCGLVFFVASVLLTTGAAGLQAQGQLTVSPGTVNFGSTPLGSSSAISITLQNSGNSKVVFSKESLQGMDFDLLGFAPSQTLDAGKELTLIVQFAPQNLGSASGTLSFESDAANGTLYVPLTGTGISPAAATLALTAVRSSNAQANVVNVAQVTASGTATTTASKSVATADVASATGITLVQHVSKDAGTTTSSTLAFKSNNTAANWIGVCVRGGAVNETFTVTDSKGNTYRKATQFNETADGNTVAIYYAENIGAGANTITVSDTISATLRFAILEYAGVATSGSLDVAATAQGSSTAPNSGNATTTASGDLLLGTIMTSDTEAYTAGSGYKIEENVPAASSTKLIVEDEIQASAGTATANAKLGSADIWAAGLVAFKAASRTPTAATIALVQHISKDAGTTTSSTLAFKSSNAVGNWIGVSVRAGAQNETITVSDSNKNTYRKAIQFNETSDGNTIGIFYAENIAGGANTITVSDTASQSLRFAISEYSGVATSNSLDVTASAQGNSASPKTGTATTTANGDLLLGAVMTSDAENYTAGTGFNIEEHVPAEPNTKLITEGQVQATAGSATASASLGSANMWAAGLAAFKAAPSNAAAASSLNLGATPSSATFSNVPVGTSNTQSIQLKNGGASSITISSLAIQGTGFGTSGMTAPLTVAAGGTSTFNITFAPTGTGTSAGLLTLSIKGSASGLTIPLVGSGIAATRTLSANPTSINFGNVAVGGFVTSNVALMNAGNSSVTVQGVSASGTGFTATGVSTNTSIAAGQTAVLAIQFAPKSAVSVKGTITISSNSANAGTITIAVAGTGVPPTSSNHVVQLNWGASASSSVVGYNVYRSTVSGGPYTKIVSSPVSGTSYSDQSVQTGVQYYYVVTSVASNGLESSHSNESTAFIP